VRRVALAAALAAVVVAGFLLGDGLPDGAGTTVLVVLGIVLAAGPPLLLFLLAEALRALAELPERVRATPERGVEHASELRELARAPRGVLGLPRLLWRVGRLTASARELATPYAGALPLLSLPFLAWSAAAGLAALAEIATALVLLVLIAAGI